jgi:hypothetical protein
MSVLLGALRHAGCDALPMEVALASCCHAIALKIGCSAAEDKLPRK